MSSSAADRDGIRLLLLGAPGSGKGTQGTRLAERYGAPHVSTGDLLRAQVAEGTELGRMAQPYMERGDLVPDELILGMVLDGVLGPDSPPSYVLDGFPRTVAQARAAYERAVPSDRVLDAVVCLDIDHDELIVRIEQRGRESGRADDNDVRTVLHRVEEYEQKTLPLLDYYAGRDILIRIDAVGDIDEVTERITAALDALPPRE
jgi:adenylate kinase